MKKYVVYHGVSGNPFDTIFYATDNADAQVTAKKMFGEVAWAEEVDIVPSPT